MGGFIHEIAGEVPAGALLHEYFSGKSAPSFSAGIIIIKGGPAGPPFFFPWSCASAIPAIKINVIPSKNLLIIVFAPLLVDDTPNPRQLVSAYTL
jgi:hypothetical protein